MRTGVGDPDMAPRPLLVVGAHGGAGTTTLAALMHQALDMGTVSGPSKPGHSPLRAEGRPVVVVARNTVPAAWHATRAVTAIDAGRGEADGHIAALVIVSDGGRSEPKEATARFALLQGRVCGLVRMPFVPALRLVDDPTVVDLPAKARQVLETVWELAFRRPCH
jgi:hypothetical protein